MSTAHIFATKVKICVSNLLIDLPFSCLPVLLESEVFENVSEARLAPQLHHLVEYSLWPR